MIWSRSKGFTSDNVNMTFIGEAIEEMDSEYYILAHAF